MPPGVSVQSAPAPNQLPLDDEAESLTVDWTHPLLRVRTVHGLTDGRRVPRRWDHASAPDSVRLQLIEPVRTSGPWRLGLHPPGRPGQPQIAQDVIAPWQPFAGANRREPALDPAFAPIGQTLPVRWLGRKEDLGDMDALDFGKRVMISMTTADATRTRFVLVHRKEAGRGRMTELTGWLRAAAPAGGWIGVHSIGEDALAGIGDWRLTAPSDPRRVERLGLALELAPVKPTEPVDWARLSGVRLQASSRLPGYGPRCLTSGRLWPTPFEPLAWISDPEMDREEAPYVEMHFDHPRPIERVVLGWAKAAGWSAHFNPGRAVLSYSPGHAARTQQAAVFEAPEGAVSEWRPSQPIAISMLRVTFEQPSAQPADPHARLAAFMALGPWDGQTEPLPSIDAPSN